MEKTNRKIKLSLILPIYNEEDSIANFLEDFYSNFQNDLLYELIVVDDNSDDKSVEIVKKHKNKTKNIKLIKNLKRIGRGGSFKLGLKEAQGEIIGYMDSDGQIEVENIRRAIKLIESGYDLVVGERIEKNTKLIRRFFSYSFRIVAHFLRGLPSKDPLTGFKFFKREVLLRIIEKSQDNYWFFDFEIVEISFKNRFKIANLPIIFWDYNNNHISKTKLLTDSIYYLRNLLFL